MRRHGRRDIANNGSERLVCLGSPAAKLPCICPTSGSWLLAVLGFCSGCPAAFLFADRCWTARGAASRGEGDAAAEWLSRFV